MLKSRTRSPLQKNDFFLLCFQCSTVFPFCQDIGAVLTERWDRSRPITMRILTALALVPFFVVVQKNFAPRANRMWNDFTVTTAEAVVVQEFFWPFNCSLSFWRRFSHWIFSFFSKIAFFRNKKIRSGYFSSNHLPDSVG